jgi:hypothetical protein
MGGRRTPPTPFRVDEALALADDVLSRPPARPHIERPVRRGELVARFALPLELCLTTNFTRHGQAWRLAKLKNDTLLLMLSQCGRAREPLAGRPQVLCLRLSSAEPDKYSDWAKVAVDRLTNKNSGLGFLRDDKPSAAEIHQYWEPCPPKKGCVVIEVRSER